jgi:hypothetical protein
MNNILTRPFLPIMILMVILTPSCHKKTSSNFRLGRYEYAPGETLDLINLSLKKRNQIWEILNPEGNSDTIVEGKAPQLTLNVLGKDGLYTVKVYDNKKELEKNVASYKLIKVSAIRGKIVIYSNPFSWKSFPVNIDNQHFTGSHLVQYNLPYGVHSIKASCVYYTGGPTHYLDTVITVNSQITQYLYLN